LGFPNGQNQWLQRGCGINVENGETYLINCTWDAWSGTGRRNHEAYIHVNGWQRIGTYFFYYNHSGVHSSQSTSFIWTNNFGTVNNPTVMLRTEAGGYTDGNSIGNMTMLKIN